MDLDLAPLITKPFWKKNNIVFAKLFISLMIFVPQMLTSFFKIIGQIIIQN